MLRRKTDSVDEIELLAFVDGAIVGSAGIGCVDRKEKTRHRAEFGISVDKTYWGLGVGRALTGACIECARTAGYVQLELMAVAENKAALALYKSVGFVEYGRNPKGFRSRTTGWQELVLMRLELNHMGNEYQYRRLDNTNFSGHSLDGFVRRQTVTECWRKTGSDWKLVPNAYEENWSLEQCREIAEDVVHHINLDQTGFGAFDGERIIGFATVSHRIFGAAARCLRRGPAVGRGQTVHFGPFLKRVAGGVPGAWLYACGGGQ